MALPLTATTGSPDLLMMLVKLAQEQMQPRLCFSRELECTVRCLTAPSTCESDPGCVQVLEVKKIEGLGTTVDVCLVNGELKDTDSIVVATSNGPGMLPRPPAVSSQLTALACSQW
jgi:translation initiation factor 5B